MGAIVVGLIESFYTNFILRDLTYVALGALPLCFAIQWFAPESWSYFDHKPKLTLAAFLVLSYLIGQSLWHSAIYLEIVRIYPQDMLKNFETQEVQAIADLMRIHTHYKGSPPKQLERIIYLKQANGIVAIMLFCFAPLWLVNAARNKPNIRAWTQHIGLAIICISLALGAHHANNSKAEIQQKLIEKLLSEIQSTEEKETTATKLRRGVFSIEFDERENDR